VSIVTLLLIALGLSADAFAVALGKGLQMRRFDVRSALALACTFGAFQAAMPLLGWALGSQFERYITTYDHWIAFALLTIVGVKMLRDAASPEEAGAASGEVGQVAGGHGVPVCGGGQRGARLWVGGPRREGQGATWRRGAARGC
jgi:putative Mn2+ efflux pump MntP